MTNQFSPAASSAALRSRDPNSRGGPKCVPGSIPPRPVERCLALALSRDKYEFDPGAERWRLSKEVTIHVGAVLERLAPPLREPYRRLLQFHAEHYSSGYCSVIHHSVNRFLMDTAADEFSESALRTYRASLGRANESRLGAIRPFLRRWHDRGYLGVSSAAVEFLASVTLRGSEKGAPVLSLDPRQGPFDDQELEAILIAVAQHYERGDIDISVLAFTLLLVHTGRPSWAALTIARRRSPAGPDPRWAVRRRRAYSPFETTRTHPTLSV